MKTFYIGIDISKDWLDYAICKDLKRKMEVKRVDNSKSGITSMIKDCKKLKEGLWFCMEHTGNYGLLLAHILQLDRLTYSMVPALEIKNSMGMQRGKSDKIDAERIAVYAAKNHFKLKPFELPGEDLLKLKSLFTHRQQLVKRNAQLKNSLKSHLKLLEIIDFEYIIEDIRDELASIEMKIQDVEKEINRVVKSNPELDANYEKIMRIKGIGPIITTFMLICTNNFTSFTDPRKFNSYAGIAPFENSSGSSKRGKMKTSNLRNRIIKTLMFNAASSAKTHDNQLKLYYQKKLKEGKAKFLILNNIAGKLIYRIFAVIKREEPYVYLAF